MTAPLSGETPMIATSNRIDRTSEETERATPRSHNELICPPAREQFDEGAYALKSAQAVREESVQPELMRQLSSEMTR